MTKSMLQGSKTKCLWPECVGQSGRGTFYRFEGGQTAGLNALTAMEANGKLQGSKTTRVWPECLVRSCREHFTGLGRASGSFERLNKRGPWTQTASFKALRPNACGHSALSKLPRNNFTGLRVGKRQA